MFGLTDPRGQPRRGRQGLLVVPRRRSRAAPGCAGATTTRRPRSRTRTSSRRTRGRSKFEPEYELLDTGVFDDDRYWIVEVHYAKAEPDRHPDAGHGPQPRARRPRRSTSCRRSGSATNGRGTRPGQARAPRPARTAGRSWRRIRSWATTRSRSAPARTGRRRRCSSARTRRTASGSRAFPTTTPYPKDGINDHVIGGRRDGQPRRGRDEGRALVPAGRPGRGDASSSGCACTRRPRPPSRGHTCRGRPEPRSQCRCDGRRGGRRQRQGRGGRRGAHGSARSVLRVHHAPARGRGRRLLRGPPSRRRGRRRASGSCARRSPACCGASSTTATTSRAGSTATRACRRRRRSG